MHLLSSGLAGQHDVPVHFPGHARPSLVVRCLCAAALVVTAPCEAATRYVFSTFKGDSVQNEKLSIYTSSDGLNFTLLSNTGYGGPTGVLRDPSLMKHSDGQYYVAYTLQSWDTSSTSFGIAKSADLTEWTFLAEVPAQVSGAKHTWAPEWFKDTDGSVHLIVSVDSPEWDFKPYVYTAGNGTLTQWSAPKPLGFGPNYIDTFIVTVGSTYHAFCKNETTKYIEHATATSLFGPWTFVGTSDWAGWGSGKEGIALFPLDNGDWRMFLDCYGGCGFLYATSSDLTKWSSTATVPGGLSGTVRHGTVLREQIGSGGSTSTGGRSSTGGSSATAPGGNSNLGGTSSVSVTTTGGTNATGGTRSIGGSNAVAGGGNKASGGTQALGGTGSNLTGGANGSGGSSQPGTSAVGGGSSTATKPQGGTLAIGGTSANDAGGSASVGGTVNSPGSSALGATQSVGGTAAIGTASSRSSVAATTGSSDRPTGGATADVANSNASDAASRSGCSCSLPGRPARTGLVLTALSMLGLIVRRRRE